MVSCGVRTNLAAFSTLVLGLVLLACPSPTVSPTGSRGDVSDSDPADGDVGADEGEAGGHGCPHGAECVDDQVCFDGDCVPLSSVGWIDTKDGGDDPLEPGCHLAYKDKTCTGEVISGRADQCRSATLLLEYTDRNCHTIPPYDEVVHDCDAVCKANGHASGTCSLVPDYCAKGWPAAQCKCAK